MARPEDLQIGKTYFTVFYADREFRKPVIETWIYIGTEAEEEAGELAIEYQFQQARSYHQEGNWNELSPSQRDECDMVPLLNFDAASLDPVVDIAGLIEELKDVRDKDQ
jgi:hypothetical protein